jgi:hypothetical protein
MKIKIVVSSIAAAVAGILLISCYQPTRYISLPPEFTLAPVSDIQSFIGTSHVKFAFTKKKGGNTRVVYYIDYQDSVPTPIPLKKPAGKEGISADSPLFSKDGRFITYYLIDGNTMYGAYIQEASPDAEPILVDAAGTEPHWWVDSLGNTYIIYSNQFIVDNGALANLTGGKTYRRPVTFNGSSASVGTNAEEIAPKPMNGGLSKDGKYLCTGYMDAAFYDIPDHLPIPIDQGVQTCNPSITPDSVTTNRMMFLNFQGVQNLLGTFASDATYPKDTTGSIMQHKVIFIVDATNTVQTFLPLSIANAIQTYAEWQDPEWSNKTGFCTALGVPNADQQPADGLVVNISTKTVCWFVMNIDNTSTPSLWIGG